MSPDPNSAILVKFLQQSRPDLLTDIKEDKKLFILELETLLLLEVFHIYVYVRGRRRGIF